MKDVKIKNGKFVIDSKEHFLFSAEIHYFRIPFNDWEDRLRKIKDAGFNTVSFYVPWSWHEINDGIFDFSGKTLPERDLLSFLKLLDNMNFNIIFKPGPYVMSELKNEGLPDWVYEKIPHAIAKTLDGRIHPARIFSYLHPDYLYYVRRWYSKVLEIVKEHNIILIQIDNEVGMFQWITGHGDYNEFTIKKFEEYLSELNVLDAPSNEVENNVNNMEKLILELKNWEYGKPFSRLLLKMYHEFSRLYYANYLNILKSYVSEVGLSVPTVVNIHGFDMVEYAKRGKNFPVGVSQLIYAQVYNQKVQRINGIKSKEITEENNNTETTKNVENCTDVILSGDYYIGNITHENFTDVAIANAVMYAVQNNEQPLFSIEFQSGFQLDKPKLQPSTFELTSLQCIGHGMNGINYYMFVGGQNPKGFGLMGSYHDWQAPVSANGELKLSYFVLKNVIRNINNIEKNLLDSKPVFDTFFGFIPSYYSTEFSKEHGFDESELIFKRDISIFDGVIRGLKLLNFNFSGVNLEGEDNYNLSAEKYPSIWVFSYKYMPSLVQKKLVRYVENGGKLILFPEIPVLDEFYRPYKYLHDYLGIASVEKESWRFANVFDTEINTYHIDKYTFEASNFSENAMKIFGRTYDDRYCAFKKTFSNGMVFVLGCGVELEREYKLSVIKEICNVMQIKQRLFLDSKDGFIDGYLRESKNMFFVFLNNYDDYEKTVEIFIDNKSYGTVLVKARQGSVKKYEKAF